MATTSRNMATMAPSWHDHSMVVMFFQTESSCVSNITLRRIFVSPTYMIVMFSADPLAHFDWTILLVEWEVSDVKIARETSCDERRPSAYHTHRTVHKLLLKCRILDFN